MPYFSEREHGEAPRNIEEIGEAPWGGIQALIRARIEDGSFGASYPNHCPDGCGPVGTDETRLWQAIRAEIPGLPERPWYVHLDGIPGTLDILDMVEFSWRSIGKPEQGSYHSFFDHHHLTFNIDAGRTAFVEAINRIFRKNGLAYQLTEEGRIERLAPSILREELAGAQFRTPDGELNRLLETARRKFLNSNETIRREALEALWDGWERLKTLGSGKDKKSQVGSLLNGVAGASSPKFREALDRDGNDLTWIGNNLQIRHSETTQERLTRSEHIDYVFHRLFALVQMVLRTNGWH